MPSDAELAAIKTNIPARLDRLPWCRFHVLIIVALGVTWILDVLEVTIVGSIGPVLQDPQTLALSAEQIGASASSYVVGAVCGALIFGWLTDRFGRRFVFYVTLIVYLTGVLLTAVSWNFWSFAAFRAITGMGIGGEYAAINSAIDELIPATYRGRVDLMVNGSFWLGAAAGSGASLVFLDPNIMPIDLGWRFGFAIGGLLGLSIILLRGYVPESPRWLVTHGWEQQADASMSDIEQRVRSDTGLHLAPAQNYLELHPQKSFGLGLILRTMLQKYRERSMLALALMTAQAFLFNAVFFFVWARPHYVFRHRWPPRNDRWDLCRGRGPSARDSDFAQHRRFHRMDADNRLDGGLLFRLGGGKFSLPDRQRDFSPRGARSGSCGATPAQSVANPAKALGLAATSISSPP